MATYVSSSGAIDQGKRGESGQLPVSISSSISRLQPADLKAEEGLLSLKKSSSSTGGSSLGRSRQLMRRLLSERNQFPERAAEIDRQLRDSFERKVAILSIRHELAKPDAADYLGESGVRSDAIE
jgi:hypothetical protein